MTKNDKDPTALNQPAGAVFYRCALQVNPHHYGETFRGQPTAGDPASHARAIVDAAADLGIAVLAITDHNDVSQVPTFVAAGKLRGLHVFPGFEISSNEGVHVLCIYPLGTGQDTLGRYLGEFGITKTGPSSDLSSKNFVDILEQVRVQGGVTIAAHVTSDKGGLLKVLKGQARIRAWQSKDLLALQIPGSPDDLLDDLRPIVKNKSVDYRREHTAEDDLAIAVVNAKDIVKPEDLSDRSATCWIKMSTVSIEGLRQAFLDPGSRIRLNPAQGAREPQTHAELVSLAWDGSKFLDGASIRLNPNLNVLVGGRGTGKSTIVESIRSVLGLDPLGDEARKAHEGIVRQVLQNGTKISLRVRLHRPTEKNYAIERTLPNPPIVKDENGQLSKLTPSDVLPRVEVFGQHEISELAKSREKRTRLLDRFAERNDDLPRTKANLRRDLEKSRRSLIDARAERRQIEERLAALPGLEETLVKFKEAGLEERLKEQSLLVREERLLDSIPERLTTVRECLQTLGREANLDRTFVSQKALAELPGKEILAPLDGVFLRLEQDLQRVSKDLEGSLQRAEQGVEGVCIAWAARKASVQGAYEKILRELQKSRVDGEEFLRLRRQIEELRPLRERHTSILRVEKEHLDRRRALLVEWEELKAGEFRRLDRAARNVNQQLKGRVQVAVTAAGDREPLFQFLREDVGGRLTEAIDRFRSLPALSLTQLVDACRNGAQALIDGFKLSPGQAERMAKAEPEVLMRIEELELLPTMEIQLNTAAAGDPPVWQALESLSTGQKATAVLLLLLLESDSPLIVDQPEDDLDNRFITEGIVPRMREEKQRRQFIFSTHNANIPVLGDAELIVGLEASGDADHGRVRITPDHMGSIDDRPVRELVEEILEGGKEAFEKRRRKYGF